MESPESLKLAITLKQLAAQGGDIAQITEAVVSTWMSIEAALAPVIGTKGVAALYGRSLYLTVPGHPWLAALYTKDDTPMDLVHLRTVLAQQGSSAAAAAGGAHLQLLASLIGPSLTRQLLRAAWDNPFERPAPEDSP